MRHNVDKQAGKIIAILLLITLLIMTMQSFKAVPGGAEVISSRTENVTPRPGAAITTVGGSFTTMVLNITSQTLKWKAYVGNVTGRFTLDNAHNYTIYDWGLLTVAGEIYVSRNSSVDLSNLACAGSSTLSSEMVYLNHNDTMSDSINRTFNRTIHQGFFAGIHYIQNSSCPSIATYVNDTSQPVNENATFQEVLLQDQGNLVYAGILTDAKYGYDRQLYDFQMIVAENEYRTSPTTYYFWAELS